MTLQTYTLTAEEFTALGGTPPPDDYVPGERRWIQSTGMRGQQFHATHGVVPAVQPDCLAVWEGVAERVGVRLFSIRWHDPYYPEFEAEPVV